MVATILVDTRETRLLRLLQDRIEDAENRIRIVPLEIGDIHVIHEEHNICFVFERKTDRDLNASIKDGRYREQKLRMKHSYPSHCCTYIIENMGDDGRAWFHSNVMNDSTYQGAIVNTMYRDKMHVVVVSNIEGTADWISTLYKRVAEKPENFVEAQNADEKEIAVHYIDHVKVKKRKIENVDRKTCYLLQWCQIPGISQKIATEMAERYSSWNIFFSCMNALSSNEEKIKEICKIPKIGDKKARTILEYLQVLEEVA